MNPRSHRGRIPPSTGSSATLATAPFSSSNQGRDRPDGAVALNGTAAAGRSPGAPLSRDGNRSGSAHPGQEGAMPGASPTAATAGHSPWQILEAQTRWVSAPSVLPSEGRVCPDGPIDRLVCRPRPSPEVRSVSIPAPRRYFNWTSKLTALASLSRAGPFGLDSRLRGCPLFPCACWNAPSGGGGAGRGWILFKASLAGTVSQVGHPWPKRATVCNVYLLNWPLWN